MKRWEVTIRETEVYTLEVEAETEEDAKAIAWGRLEDGTEADKFKRPDDSGGTAEAFEVD